MEHLRTHMFLLTASSCGKLVILAVFLVGCANLAEMERSDGFPELVYQTPLPAMPKTISDSEMKLSVLFRIAKDGTVLETRLLSPTGDKGWDAQAAAEMLQWRFSASHLADTMFPLWIRLPLRVHWMEPTVYRLAEIACREKALADSAFALLSAGRDFKSVVAALSEASSRSKDGLIGDIDIRVYPSRIRAHLKRLGENEFTEPLQFGDSFVIFKRLSGGAVDKAK